MASTFHDRIAQLKRHVGDGTLAAAVKVDQVYAQPQEIGYWMSGPNAGSVIRNHPGGGMTHALQTSVFNESPSVLQGVADHLLDDEDGAVQRAMIDGVEKVSATYGTLAPIEFGDLRESTHPTVTDNDEAVYDRPPAVDRLSTAELRSKSRQRRAGILERHYLPKTSPRHGKAHAANGGPTVPLPAPTTHTVRKP